MEMKQKNIIYKYLSNGNKQKDIIYKYMDNINKHVRQYLNFRK